MEGKGGGSSICKGGGKENGRELEMEGEMGGGRNVGGKDYKVEGRGIRKK